MPRFRSAYPPEFRRQTPISQKTKLAEAILTRGPHTPTMLFCGPDL